MSQVEELQIAGVIQREGLAQALQSVFANKRIVGLHQLQHGI